MNGTFRQSMNWLHTWSGLLLSSLLYFIFITGTVGYFDKEITHWMQPERPAIDKKIDQQNILKMAEQHLNITAPDAQSWWVVFPIGRSYSAITWWQESDEQGGKWKSNTLNLQTGEAVITRETGGGKTLYAMHYLLHYIPKTLGYWITSLCAMFMFIALITGIIVHKKIFKEFFTFRPNKKQRSWLDIHNIFSVLPIPFHLMITYSGLVFLMFSSMPGVIVGSYGTSMEKYSGFVESVFQKPAHPEHNHEPANTLSMLDLMPEIESRWGKNTLHEIGLEGRGTAGAHVQVKHHEYSGISDGEELVYHGITGELLFDSMKESHPQSASKKLYNVLTDLHEGNFAGIVLRWLYFISGLMGAGMIATGMVLWATKRRERSQRTGKESTGLQWVEYSNMGIIVGLPLAIAVYFWANRIIPIDFANRENWEINSLFITWGIMLIGPLVLAKKYSPLSLWLKQLALASALYLLLPVLNAITSDKSLVSALLQGDWVMAGFDITMILLGLIFGYAARRIMKKMKTKE
ncbi:MAG: PepSY domain-containing protein [Oleispira sp.]|nr:PepSY domain-containing protein [Oleispira sp.]